jgi:hypothetical protein
MLEATRRTTVAVAVALLLGACATAARADGGVGGVDCQQRPDAAECNVDVGIPGNPGDGGGNGGNGDDSGGGSGGDDHCYYQLAERQAPTPAGAAAGAWYVRICIIGDGKGGNSQSAPMWIEQAPQVDSAVLARSARSKLALPVPAIRTNPDASKTNLLVTVPVWLWVDSSSWGARSTTASVPGMSVAATATATKVVWQLGDATSITCGQGTVWTAGTDPTKASPTCGHTYLKPGNITLSATVTWTVTWTGGGQSGTVPDLTTTAQTNLHVAEAPALNTGRR